MTDNPKSRYKRDAKQMTADNTIRHLNSKKSKTEDDLGNSDGDGCNTLNFSSMVNELTDINRNTLTSIQLTSAKPLNTEHIKLDSSLEDSMSEVQRMFKTLRELTDIDEKKFITQMCDRHNYFKKNYPHLKEAAFEAMNSKEYSSSKVQSMAVLDALQLTLRTRTLESKSIEPILMIELDCEYDACFMGLESEIYKQIIDYFRVMLV
ncbi:GH10358 [Drosophila grimshawi]|uniref:GH10358 n=1 Tax=Drosophila grimshawi TaxID=7222 RepID=B4JEI4_DROGR|nr:GH10358 [Drosophila grimshawi]